MVKYRSLHWPGGEVGETIRGRVSPEVKKCGALLQEVVEIF